MLLCGNRKFGQDFIVEFCCWFTWRIGTNSRRGTSENGKFKVLQWKLTALKFKFRLSNTRNSSGKWEKNPICIKSIIFMHNVPPYFEWACSRPLHNQLSYAWRMTDFGPMRIMLTWSDINGWRLPNSTQIDAHASLAKTIVPLVFCCYSATGACATIVRNLNFSHIQLNNKRQGSQNISRKCNGGSIFNKNSSSWTLDDKDQMCMSVSHRVIRSIFLFVYWTRN